MDIKDFISRFKTHPVLFMGTGISLRYLNDTFSWDSLLKNVVINLCGNDEKYYDIKSKYHINGICAFEKVASEIEGIFNSSLEQDRNGKFKEINDIFYENMRNGQNISRFKIYLATLFSQYSLKDCMEDELKLLKQARKNIGSVITTNYDSFLENTFEFSTLIGNNILLSNPYGSIYKIHGCHSSPADIVITKDDYDKFEQKYHLIRAQLLSLFIHSPIIFMGYGLGDDNVKKILSTIFDYVDVNSTQAEEIRQNFLVVEYVRGSSNTTVENFDIVIEGAKPIKINKLKTDDFSSVYQGIAELTLPISAMDIRKVQNVVKDIYAGGSIKVKITESIDELKNSDMVIAIGSEKSIYTYIKANIFINDYFSIIDEVNSQIIKLLPQITIQTSQFFPCYGFRHIVSDLEITNLLDIQNKKLDNMLGTISTEYQNNHTTIENIENDVRIGQSYKNYAIISSIIEGKISLDSVEQYLRCASVDKKKTTEYKRILTVYDYLKYSGKTLKLKRDKFNKSK